MAAATALVSDSLRSSVRIIMGTRTLTLHVDSLDALSRVLNKASEATASVPDLDTPVANQSHGIRLQVCVVYMYASRPS